MTKPTIDQVAALLQATRFTFSSENDLQRGIDAMLQAHGVVAQREVVLGPGDRIDFVADGGIGIEVKVRGSASTLGRQVARYLSDARLTALIVVTSRTEHTALPATIGSKPVLVVHLMSSMF